MCLWELPCSSTDYCKSCSGDFCASCAAGYKTAFIECNKCPAGTYFSSTEKDCLGRALDNNDVIMVF